MDIFVYWIHREIHTDIEKEGYVGVSKDPQRRFKEHNKGTNNPRLYRALKKYEDIKVDIIFKGTESECYKKENKLRPSPNIGWNFTVGGVGGSVGYKHTQEAKHKMSLAKKGKPQPESIKANQFKKGIVPWNKGKKASEEMIEILRENGKKVVQTGKNNFIQKKRKVRCVELNIIFDSVKEAEEYFNAPKSKVSAVCKGKRKKTCGYTFEYYEKENNEIAKTI